jgi:hypothetical protein
VYPTGDPFRSAWRPSLTHQSRIKRKGKAMAKFIITETTRETWKTVYEVEAETKDEAREIFLDGNALEKERRFYDQSDSEFIIQD